MMQVAVFGGGCFWCIEAVFQRLKGITSVTSGYMGGSMDEATYEEVSTGRTGHAEVIKVEYDPDQIKFSDLLNVFFSMHDPTTLNRQGNDVGPQYRSVIFYTSDEQRIEAEEFMSNLAAQKVFNHPIVTEVRPAKQFFAAEKYHQQYYDNNPNKPYCQLVIDPKVAKLRQKFVHLLKE